MFPRMPLTAATLAALATAALTASSASAAPVAVSGGSVLWGQANIYSPVVAGQPVARTFVGHTTNPGVPTRGQSNGTVTPSAGATLTDPTGAPAADVNPTSARGASAVYTFGYPVASGTVDTAARSLDVVSTGTIGYAQYPALIPGAPAVLTVKNPHVVITGDTGYVYASGTSGTAAGEPYDATTPLFTLDASGAVYSTSPTGAVTVSGLIPTLALAGVYGSATQYVPGTAGPDRSPNTFGGFSVTAVPTPATPAPTPEVTPTTPVVETPAPATPAAVTPAPAAAAPLATPTIEFEKFSGAVTRQAFNAKRAITVKIRKRGEWTILGEGTVKGKTLTLKLKPGTKLQGDYVLRRVSASTVLPKSKVITISGS